MFIVQPYWKCPWDVHNFFLLSGSIFELNPADTVHHRMKQCELSNHHVTMFSPLVITDYVPFPCSLSWFLYFRFSSATMSLLIWHVPVPLMPCHCSVWRSGMEQKKLLKNILWFFLFFLSFWMSSQRCQLHLHTFLVHWPDYAQLHPGTPQIYTSILRFLLSFRLSNPRVGEAYWQKKYK